MQKYVNEGKPLDVLDEQERFCISLMEVPTVARRIKALGLKFTAAEKAAEAAAIFKVGVGREGVYFGGGGRRLRCSRWGFWGGGEGAYFGGRAIFEVGVWGCVFGRWRGGGAAEAAA